MLVRMGWPFGLANEIRHRNLLVEKLRERECEKSMERGSLC